MELDMKKEKHSSDEKSKQSVTEILLDIKYRLNHLEDIQADNREFIIKLVKQTNQIVKFLSKIERRSLRICFLLREVSSSKKSSKVA